MLQDAESVFTFSGESTRFLLKVKSGKATESLQDETEEYIPNLHKTFSQILDIPALISSTYCTRPLNP
jgi:hypothetical protein